MIDLFETGIGALLGAGGATLAHRGGGLYHDALRPLAPDLRGPDPDRRALAGYGWGVSHRFVAWFALPFSLLSGAVVSHLIFLPAEVIGIRSRSRLAAALGAALFGALAFALVELAYTGLGDLDVDVIAATFALVRPILWLYPLLPFLAALKLTQGERPAAAAVAVTELAFAGGLALAGADAAVAPAAALGGLVALFAAHLWQSADDSAVAPQMEVSPVRPGSALVVLLGVGALVAVLAQAHRLAGEPLAAMLIGSGHEVDAAAVALITAAAFVPLVALSSAASDSFSTQGTPDLIPAYGYLAPAAIPAAIGGALLIALDAVGGRRAVGALLARPAISRVAAAVREALGDVTLLTLLFGGIWMGAILGGPLGALVVGGAWLLNEQAGSPVTRLAVAPTAALAVGLGANLWQVIG